jgi:hypothetical protein
MASRQSIARKLGMLVMCLVIAGAGCDDDNAADSGHSHGDGDGHSDEGHSHGEAGSGGEGHGHDEMIGPLTGAECPDDSILTYDNFGKKFMADYCTTCHSSSLSGAARNEAPDDHNFDTLADVDLMKEHIDQYAGSGPASTNTRMPLGNTKPTMEERQKLSEWIACGVPN